MLTIGFSTKKKDAKYVSHLKSTLGIPDGKYEIIVKVNNGSKSLSKVYNEIINEAKNDIVVLIHDDLEFETDNWGKTIIELFNKHYDFSMIGLAGAKDLSKKGVWWESNYKYGIVNHTNGTKKWSTDYCYEMYDNLEDVYVLDGLFLAINRRLFSKFNEDYDGFHFYDITASLDAPYRKGVTTKIRVTHKSEGKLSPEWEKYREKFLKEYDSQLDMMCLTFNVPSYKNIYKTPKNERITIIFYYDGREDHKVDEFFTSVMNTNYGYEHLDVIFLNDSNVNVGEIDGVRVIKSSARNKMKSLKSISDLILTDKFICVETGLEYFGDVFYELCMNVANMVSVTIRTHYKHNFIKVNSVKIEIMPNEDLFLKFGSIGEHFDYNFNDTETFSFSPYVFGTRTQNLKNYKYIENESDMDEVLFGLYVGRISKIINVTVAAVKTNDNHIHRFLLSSFIGSKDQKTLNIEIKKNQIIKQYIKNEFYKQN